MVLVGDSLPIALHSRHHNHTALSLSVYNFASLHRKFFEEMFWAGDDMVEGRRLEAAAQSANAKGEEKGQ